MRELIGVGVMHHDHRPLLALHSVDGRQGDAIRLPAAAQLGTQPRLELRRIWL